MSDWKFDIPSLTLNNEANSSLSPTSSDDTLDRLEMTVVVY